MGMMFAMDQIDYIQISQIRYSLERLAFTLALDHASEEEIRLMEEYVNKLDKSTDASVNNELDKKIHYTLARASGNVLILDILEACSSVIDEFVKDLRREIIRKESGKEALNACHHRIVKALREHNREDGILALRSILPLLMRFCWNGRINKQTEKKMSTKRKPQLGGEQAVVFFLF